MKKFVLFLFLCPVFVFAQSLSCRVLHNVPKSLKIIKDSARKIADVSIDNTCIIPLIDSLENGFIHTHRTEYLECLDSICWNCSDDVGEKLVDTVLFYKAFKPYVDYLYRNGDTLNCLELNLEAGFGFDDMDDPNDRMDVKKRLESFIEQQERSYEFPDAEKSFIETIRRRAENFKLLGE